MATPRRGGGQNVAHTRERSNASLSTMNASSKDMNSRPQTSGGASSNMEIRESVERRCVVWIHDENFSKEEVVLNLDLFPPNSVKPGELMAILALKTDAAVRDFQDKTSTPKRGMESLAASVHLDTSWGNLRSSTESVGDGHDVDPDRRYLFAVKDMSKELKTKQPHLEISVAKHIADVFGFKHRSNVLVTTTNTAMTTASHVELSFKDEYLARSDMWRLAISELTNRTVYKGQKIVFLGTIKAHVTSVFVAGRKVQSAFFSTNTKPIFRSESARFVLFIQMSREMWDFDSEGSGEIMFTKVVNGFLPALFKRWVTLKARHLVSIVLFTRVEYDTGLTSQLDMDTLDSTYHTGIQFDGARKPYKDFYRVVVSEMASGEWTTILHALKREFRYFRKDISLHRLNTVVSKTDVPGDAGMGSVPGTWIEAEPTLAIHGNVLEAINLASTQFSHDYIDRDLVRTGISVVLITPGPGLFEVDYETLRTTTETLISSGIGIDLVCMPKIPLHSVPLFRYRNPQFTEFQDSTRMKDIGSGGSTPRQSVPTFGSYATLHESLSPTKYNQENGRRGSILVAGKAPEEWNFAIPHWLDVSFWTGATQDLLSRPGAHLVKEQKQRRSTIRRTRDFAVRCKMYELEMSSTANDSMVEISVAPLQHDLQYPQAGKELLESPIGEPLHIHLNKKHASLSETVLGPVRWSLDRKTQQSDKELFEALDNYDDKTSICVIPSSEEKADSRKHVKLESDKAVKQILAEDPDVFGTSYNEGNDGPKGLSLVGAALTKKKVREAGEAIMKPRTDSVTSTVSKSSTLLSLRPPKMPRQISLGKHGFGIAAPKAAAAEIQTEHASAAKITKSNVMGTGPPTSSSAMASHLLSSPRHENKTDRPASSQGSLRSSKESIHSSEQHPVSEAAKVVVSRPITIKSAYQAPEVTGQHQGRSILGSLFEAPAGELNNVPTMQKLKSSDSLRASKSKLLAGSMAALPTTLSPTTALSPWLNVLNPSNPTVDDNIASQYKRWQHVFPRPTVIKAMKWKSLCAPASVPLTTEFFPTRHQLSTEYHQTPHNISQYAEEELSEEPKSRDDFLRELVSLRLSQGFQIVVGSAVAEAFGQKVIKIANAFDREHIAEDGASIFMAMGNSIHQLSCVNGTEIEVNLFIRKSTASTEEAAEKAATPYRPAIRTTIAKDYESRQILFAKVNPKDDINWNLVDSFIAGHDDEMSEGLRFWRARFVFIPVQQSSFNARPRGEDSEEEIRLEGIRALTQLWQRYRYIPPSEKQFPTLASRKKKRDMNPLDIVYQTQDPSMVVNAELETLPLVETGEAHIRRGQLLSDSEPFRKSSLKIADLAEAIQAPVDKGGVRMQNRRWHFRLHYNCFIGSDMTTWLMENFEDIESREEAVELGNMLMAKDEEKRMREKDASDRGGKEPDSDIGIFVHVEKRHPFRDGQYFYQLVGEFAKPRPDTRGGWPFGSKRRDPSVPSTPMAETGTRDSPKPERTRSSSNNDERSSDSGAATPTTNSRKTKVALSKVMKYDVDPRKRSYRPERINLHYDRLHNPDNCYHIRLDWMNVTAKLIEDAIQSWATTAERYGLRLIEVPIGEACSITDIHPFRSPYMVTLAAPPPEKQPPTFFDATSFVAQGPLIRHVYQKAILKKHDFVLDIEAAQNFPANVEVIYSWGRPDYKYSQYIHRSGVLLAQITDDGNFLLLANKLYNNRAGASRDQERFIRPDYDRSALGIRVPSQSTPLSSPMVRPTAYINTPPLRPLGSTLNAAADVLGYSLAGSRLASLITPESIKDELEKFCSDASVLKGFYQEVFDRATPPSATPPNFRGSDLGYGAGIRLGDIPTLGLPPGVLARDSWRDGGSGSGPGSPAPMRFVRHPERRLSQHPSDSGSITGTTKEGESPRGSVSGSNAGDKA